MCGGYLFTALMCGCVDVSYICPTYNYIQLLTINHPTSLPPQPTICKMQLFKLENVFVQLVKCICANYSSGCSG